MKPICWIPLLALLGGSLGYAIFRATGRLGATSGVIVGVLIGTLVDAQPQRRQHGRVTTRPHNEVKVTTGGPDETHHSRAPRCLQRTARPCAIASAISALSNRSLLAQSAVTRAAPTPPERLAALDKARLAGTLPQDHLERPNMAGLGSRFRSRSSCGQPESNSSGASPDLPSPSAASGGGLGSRPGDDFQGQPWSRRLSDAPQNFTVRVGDGWAASMATKGESDRPR